jgi:ubiquinone/menaquinone biosynthesis C-methylase UbiE
MKINFGAGRKIENGYFNIDAIRHPMAQRDPELLFTMRFNDDGSLSEQIPLADGCADEVMSIHVIEHFYRFNTDAVIAEFKRLLKDGGKLVLECPNIESACRNLLAGMEDKMAMWPLYGSPKAGSPFMSHLWGWTPKTLSELLKFHGFKHVNVMPPQTHMTRGDRDMRVEAIK